MKLGVLACWALLQLPLAAQIVADITEIDRQQLNYTEGTLSLAVNLRNPGGGVYLVNDTDRPAGGVVSELANPFLEAKIGGAWKRCQHLEPVCASGPPPESLPPRSLMQLVPSMTAKEGEQEAEMRYAIYGGAWVSPSFRGRYSTREYELAGRDIASRLRPLGMLEAFEARNWKTLPYAHGPEEFIALLELERFYNDSRVWVPLAEKCAKAMPMDEKTLARFHSAATDTLARPWPNDLDERALFERCVTALSALPAGKNAYGSPERCRATVWRRLAHPSPEADSTNPERQQELADLRASGNPWGVGEDRLVVIVDLAVKALSAKDRGERAAAAEFLKMDWVGEEFLPEGGTAALLKLGTPEAKQVVEAIRRRAKQDKPTS